MSTRESAGSQAHRGLLSRALIVQEASVESWGVDRAVKIVGRSAAMQKVLEKVEKLARFKEPVLIRGESGVGKESVAQALYLLGPRRGRPLEVVNCPQYRNSDTMVSELFGHTRGSFTGAIGDHQGIFERARGGVVFLDEVADLSMSAQSMLLRALASGEVQALGARKSRRVDVRVLAATNRPLNQLAADDHMFRRDLLWRLQFFSIEIPPLRERGEDWRLLLDHALEQLAQRYGEHKTFSADALKTLEGYPWPGNVRELLALATSSFALADGHRIEVKDLPQLQLDSLRAPETRREEARLLRLESGESDFWAEIQKPYLDRDLNRTQVQSLISEGLDSAETYLQLLLRWGGDREEYQKFMDFLRHHRLKPESSR